MEKDYPTNVITNDKYDYLISACCGILSGIFDIVFVGEPGDSKLGSAIETLTGGYIQKAINFFSEKEKQLSDLTKQVPEPVQEASQELIRNALIRFGLKHIKNSQIDEETLKESSSEDIIKLLMHNQDVIGLVFAIIDQFSSGGASSDKKIIIHTGKKDQVIAYLQGYDYISKLYCGFINWLGIQLTDLKSKRNMIIREDSRVTGVAKVFGNVLQEFDIDISIEIPKSKEMAGKMVEVFEKGYDIPFAMASSVSVLLTEIMIRAIWVLRQRFFRKCAWEDCMPSGNNKNLSRMLLVGNGAFVLVDGAEAAYHGVKAKDWTVFLSRVNLIGIARFTILVLKEAVLESGIFTDASGDPFFEGLFGRMTDADKARLSTIGEYISSYKQALDYKRALKEALEEYEQAKEERIRIEAECEAKIKEIRKYREEMTAVVESYFEQYITAFDQGLSIMDKAIADNDENAFIEGNVLIQDTLHYETQFRNKEEFDQLMSDEEEDFKL